MTVSFSKQILVGLGAGVLTGIVLGEWVGPLTILADGFVKLLQMTVLPYVTVSIVTSLGSLGLAEARRLGVAAGAVIAGLWLVGVAFAFLLPLAFPSIRSASFFSTSLIEPTVPFDFVDLYIPANPFHALANSIIPAVVLFSVVLGVALIGVERKRVLLDPLTVAGEAIARATRFVTRLTPYGVFAIAASAAGTMDLSQATRIEVYLIAYTATATLVALWVLPGLVAALTPIPYLEVLRPARDALITAFVAGDLFIVLPSLIASCRTVLARYAGAEPRAETLPDVIVPVSFNFPHTGKLLSLSFVLFAGWFADALVPISSYPQLAVAGVLSFFGSLNAAVPFLLDTFRIPADTFQLFVATSVINSRFGALVAAVHTITVALLGSAAIVGVVRIEMRRLVRFAAVTAVLLVAILGGLRLGFATLLAGDADGETVVYGMEPSIARSPARVVAAPSEGGDLSRGILQAARARTLLRVAFAPDRPPYAFANRDGALVGLDVDLVYLMARDLGVEVEYSAAPVDEALRRLEGGEFDLAIGGHVVTPLRALQVRFSEAYLDETAAFIVKDHQRARFATWASIAAIRDLRVGVPPIPYYQRELNDRAPDLPVVELSLTHNPLDPALGVDAVLYAAERGSVLAMLNPQWTVVVPQPGIVKVPVALPLAGRDPEWTAWVNTWLELKRRDGTLDRLYQHWILGQRSTAREPRWSVIRNVFGWVD